MIIFFEEIPNSFDVESIKGKTIISLTPKICDFLDIKGIHYNILEDYYSEIELNSIGDKLFDQKTKWLKHFDDIMADQILELRGALYGLSSFYLGYSPIHYTFDNVLIRSYALRNFWEKVKPDKIRYYRWQKEEDLDKIWYSGNSVFSRLMPLFCEKYNTELEIIVSTSNKSILRNKLSRKGRDILRPLKQYIIRRESILLKCHNPFVMANKKLSFLFLGKEAGLDILLSEAMQMGHKCYIIVEDKIVEVSRYIDRTIYRINKENKYECKSLVNLVDDILELQLQWNWFDKLCDIDASVVLKHRYKYIITVIVPKLVSITNQFLSFFNKYNVDYLVAAVLMPSLLYSCASFAARQKKVSCIILRHGETIRDARIWELRDMFPSDHLIVVNKEVCNYFTSKTKMLGFERPKVHIGDYRFRSALAVGKKRSKRLVKKSKKPLVVYVPSALAFDKRYLAANNNYPCLWYYKLQKGLVDYFAKRRDYNFIFKGLPRGDFIYNPINRYIEICNAGNITYSKKPFVEWLFKADYVLLDHPDTTLYESIAAKVPYFVLMHPIFRVRQSAVSMLEQRCSSFTTIEDAITRVKYFLDNPDLPVNFDGFIEKGSFFENLQLKYT